MKPLATSSRISFSCFCMEKTHTHSFFTPSPSVLLHLYHSFLFSTYPHLCSTQRRSHFLPPFCLASFITRKLKLYSIHTTTGMIFPPLQALFQLPTCQSRKLKSKPVVNCTGDSFIRPNENQLAKSGQRFQTQFP